MCGIVGIAGGMPAAAEVRSMLASISHRGPDDQGMYAHGEVCLGHVRLAILDLSAAGRQPMTSPDGRYTLVYNGELYNHADFRPDLETKGVRFRGHSDTETLLWLLIRHQERILPRLNGIFALAFYDSVTGDLLLARDHMGVKPLYYAWGNQRRLLFASEIKALFATGEVEARANLDDLLELLMFHFIAGDRTAFANVCELRPGHWLRYAHGRIRIREFWNPVTQAREAAAGNGHGDTLRLLLGQAVRRQLMADVPVGVMASGGIDSGVVMACAGAPAGGMQGFCFRDPFHGYDELEEARRVGRQCGVDVEAVEIAEREVPELFHKVTWYYDEPIPRPHHLAAYLIARRARQRGLKVLLSGEGGDELFGGYARYLEVAGQVRAGGDSTPLVFGHNRVALPRIARFFPSSAFANAARFWFVQETDGFDPVNRQLLIDQKSFLQHFLQRSDRMGMAEGVEIRVPLLDIPLVNYVNRVPGDAKIANGETKVMLKRAAGQILPAAVVQRPKQPFDFPMAPLLLAGPMAAYMDEMLLDRPRCGEIFDARGIAGLLADLRAGQQDLWKVAWMLLATEVWMRRFRVTV